MNSKTDTEKIQRAVERLQGVRRFRRSASDAFFEFNISTLRFEVIYPNGIMEDLSGFGYTLAECEGFVRNGLWEEVSDFPLDLPEKAD